MDLLTLLIIAYLPALGLQIGAAIAEAFESPRWLLGTMLHAAAGVALAVVSLELAPRSLATAPLVCAILAFAAGATLSVGLAVASRKARRLTGARQGALAAYAVALADLLGDSLMTGAATASTLELGLLLGGSQVIANIPSGFAAAAHLRQQGGRLALRIGLAACAPLPAVGAMALGWLTLRGQPATVQAVALCAVAGLLLCATVEDLIPEADKPQSPRAVSTAALVAGFVLVAALSRLLAL